MAMHNKKLAHEEEKPCFLCGKPTKALNRGVLEAHPRCGGCKARLAEEFNKALTAQRKQDEAARSKLRINHPKREA